jgi:hypothetical protein
MGGVQRTQQVEEVAVDLVEHAEGVDPEGC